MDPEKIHDRMIQLGEFFGNYKLARLITRKIFFYSNHKLRQEILEINFPNPIGLAAGFDKNAKLTNILPSIGFGFAEVGSITGEPCRGNPKPRIKRLIKSKSLLINSGLNNQGCERIYQRLKNKKFLIPIGVNIAKTNSKSTVELNKGIADYLKVYNIFQDFGSYVTINISCPNAFGGQPFTENEKLEPLLKEINKKKISNPIFLKISPDLTKVQISDIIKLAGKYKIDGFICSNLSKNRNNSKIIDKNIPNDGGLSGKIVEDLSNNLISHIYKKTQGRFIIIGCGGVSSVEDAYKKIRLGASLLQLITGMIYEGPQLINEINSGLVKLLERDGFNNISEAIGIDNTFLNL